MATPGYHGARYFHPETPTERRVTADLRRKGYDVVLYLAGAGILISREPLAATRALLRNSQRLAIQGPVFVTPKPRESSPPNEAFLSNARDAFKVLRTAGQYGSEVQGWTVTMRPLRAANQTCVQCHLNMSASLRANSPSLKTGDLLGVAIYAYRQR